MAKKTYSFDENYYNMWKQPSSQTDAYHAAMKAMYGMNVLMNKNNENKGDDAKCFECGTNLMHGLVPQDPETGHVWRCTQCGKRYTLEYLVNELNVMPAHPSGAGSNMEEIKLQAKIKNYKPKTDDKGFVTI